MSYSFYSCLPDSPSEHLRYGFVKFLLLRKASQILLEGVRLPDLPTEYYSSIITKPPYMQG